MRLCGVILPVQWWNKPRYRRVERQVGERFRRVEQLNITCRCC
jgi:hypothetical protein